MYWKDFINLNLSQFVAVIYEDDLMLLAYKLK